MGNFVNTAKTSFIHKTHYSFLGGRARVRFCEIDIRFFASSTSVNLLPSKTRSSEQLQYSTMRNACGCFTSIALEDLFLTVCFIDEFVT